MCNLHKIGVWSGMGADDLPEIRNTAEQFAQLARE